jgi:chromosome segregation ATPase
LEEFNIHEGLYTGVQTRESEVTSLAHDVAKYKKRLELSQAERLTLYKRIMLLEDVIERKGDHRLLADMESYYHQSAFYKVDESLPEREQLAALRQKHHEFLEHAYDKDRVQEKHAQILDDLLFYREGHLEEARNDMIEYKMALAQNRKELLFRMDQLRQLTKDFDDFRHKGYYDKKEIEYLQEDLAEANYQVKILLDNRQILIMRLEQHLDNMKEAL